MYVYNRTDGHPVVKVHTDTHPPVKELLGTDRSLGSWILFPNPSSEIKPMSFIPWKFPGVMRTSDTGHCTGGDGSLMSQWYHPRVVFVVLTTYLSDDRDGSE